MSSDRVYEVAPPPLVDDVDVDVPPIARSFAGFSKKASLFAHKRLLESAPLEDARQRRLYARSIRSVVSTFDDVPGDFAMPQIGICWPLSATVELWNEESTVVRVGTKEYVFDAAAAAAGRAHCVAELFDDFTMAGVGGEGGIRWEVGTVDALLEELVMLAKCARAIVGPLA
jgi:hypothetical protein